MRFWSVALLACNASGNDLPPLARRADSRILRSHKSGFAVLVHNALALAFWEKRGYVRGVRYRDSQGYNVVLP